MKNQFARLLFSVLLFVAITAFCGGVYGMAGAPDIPLHWLDGTPFRSYFIPSIVLLVGVGGSATLSAIAIFKRHYFGSLMTYVAAFILLLWIGIQIAIIGYVSWLQPTMIILAFAIVFLNWFSNKFIT